MEGRRRDGTQGEWSVRRDEQMGTTHLSAKGCQDLPATPEASREAEHRFSPGAFRENAALATLWFQTPSLQN